MLNAIERLKQRKSDRISIGLSYELKIKKLKTILQTNEREFVSTLIYNKN